MYIPQSLRRSAVSALLFLCTAPAVWSIGDPIGIPAADIRKQASLKTLTASSVKVFTKSPKVFTAKGILNPNTGKPTNADSMISFVVTSHNQQLTRRMKASEYYAMLNANEQEFNKLGYSLYDQGTGPVLLQEIPLESTTLQRQTQSAPKPSGPKKSASVREQQFGTKSANGMSIPRTTTTVSLAPGIVPKSVSHKEHKRWEFGNEKSFLAYLEVTAKAEGAFFGCANPGEYSDKTNCSFHADGNVGATVLGANITVLEAVADFNCPAGNASMTANANVAILGQSVWRLNESTKSTWSKNDNFSKKLSWGVPFVVPVGPINVKGEVGVTGTAGFRYDVVLSRTGLTATATPYANVTGYGEAGVDLLIAGAGVGAKITVCDAELNLSSSAVLKWSNGKLNLHDDFSADYDVHFLDGRLYAFAYVMVPQFSFSHPFVEKRYEHNFFSWSGYQLSGQLIDLSSTTPVN